MSSPLIRSSLEWSNKYDQTCNGFHSLQPVKSFCWHRFSTSDSPGSWIFWSRWRVFENFVQQTFMVVIIPFSYSQANDLFMESPYTTRPTVRIYRELWKMSTLNPVRGGLKIICLQKEGRGIIISLIPAGRTNYVPRFFQVLTVFISYIFTDAGAQGTM